LAEEIHIDLFQRLKKWLFQEAKYNVTINEEGIEDEWEEQLLIVDLK
jgi:hypothetical protein